MRTCHRGELERLGKPVHPPIRPRSSPATAHSRSQMTTRPVVIRRAMAAQSSRISPHLERVLSHPLGETQIISPHHHSRTCSQQTICNNRVGRNWPSNAPREKEKNFAEAKIKNEPPPLPLVEDSPWRGEGRLAKQQGEGESRICNAPSPFPLPRGEGFETNARPIPGQPTGRGIHV